MNGGNSKRKENVNENIAFLNSDSAVSVRAQEHRYFQLLQRIPVATYTCDEAGYIQFYNEAAAALWGRRPEIGKDQWCGSVKIYKTDGIPLPDFETPVALTLQYQQGISPSEFVIERPDGTTCTIIPHTQLSYNTDGKVDGVITVLKEIDYFPKGTREVHKKNEDTLIAKTVELEEKNRALQCQHEALKKSEERYHHMISEVQDYAILLLSREGIIENWNKGAEKIKGYTAGEAIGKHFSIFYAKEDRERKLPEQLIAEATKQGKAVHEGWRVRKDGTRFWGSIVITALHDETGDVTGFSKVTRDLTERKLADDALHGVAGLLKEKNKELEAMNQELASFAYVSSHDLQEPLRKIQTFSSRIIETESDNLSAKGKDFFTRMQNAALRMQTLIEDLLTYSRTNTAEKNFELSDLNVLLEDVKHDLKEVIDDKGAVIITSSPLPQAEVIRFQFRQLLTNILNNAIKFSKPDVPPRINLQVDTVVGSMIGNAHAHPEKTYHHITISDNGIGFEPEYRYKIFEVFQRLHGRMEYSGTGIGLAICKKIMDNHGGSITADSVPDEGATFHVYFPQ